MSLINRSKLGFNNASRLAARFLSPYRPEPSDEIVATTYLGTPVYDQLIFPKDGNEDIELSEDLILNDILFRVDRAKKIIRTPVQGRDGDVNEVISHGDYEIEISGKVVSEFPTLYPDEQVRALISIDDHLGAVGIAVNFLSLFGIDTVVIDRIEWPQQAGFYNEQNFLIRSRSENPVELQIQQNAASS